MSDKKKQQLGMNPATASNRLVKDILFNLVGHLPCFRCGNALTRETFSIEHKEPWLDSDDPSGVFFDLGNIAFSHLACNSGAGSRPRKFSGPNDRREANKGWQKAYKERLPIELRQERRRNQYQRTGK